jgi:hypothetical protein
MSQFRNFVYKILQVYCTNLKRYYNNYCDDCKYIDKNYIPHSSIEETYFMCGFCTFSLLYLYYIYPIKQEFPFILIICFAVIFQFRVFEYFERSFKDLINFYKKGHIQNFPVRNIGTFYAIFTRIIVKPLFFGILIMIYVFSFIVLIYKPLYGFTPVDEYNNWRSDFQTGYQALYHIYYPSYYRLLGMMPWEFNICVDLRMQNPDFNEEELLKESERIVCEVKEQARLNKN